MIDYDESMGIDVSYLCMYMCIYIFIHVCLRRYEYMYACMFLNITFKVCL